MPYADMPVPVHGAMGLYLHVPFCIRKCPYCSFFSVAGDANLYKEYIRAVEGQAKNIAASGMTGDRLVETIFVGGGTPSILGPEQLALLLRQFNCSFSMAPGKIETSVEVNPATVNSSDLLHLHQAGYNRVSIGIQSLSDGELKGIGRCHSAAEAIRTFREARKAGFANCNIDLMYGLPGQTVDSWRSTLHRVLDLEPDHLAMYELTIEAGTPFDRLQKQNRLYLPTEDEVMEMMSVTQELTSIKGLQRYEISNYAKPGMECRHNINYWKNGWYVGLGPGAVSYLSGRRYAVVKDVDEFCRRITGGMDWWSDIEELDPEARFRETVIMGLRMTQGISKDELFRRFGLNPAHYYGKTLNRLVQMNLLEIKGDRIFLSGDGMKLANHVMSELV